MRTEPGAPARARVSLLAPLVALALSIPPTLGALGPLAPSEARAQEQRPPPATRSAGVLGRSAPKFERCRELIEQDAAAECLDILRAMDPATLSPFEDATRLRVAGYAHAELGETGPAIARFEEAIATGALGLEVDQSLRFAASQLYLANGATAKALEGFERWLTRAEAPTATQYMTIAGAYVEADRLREATPLVERAVAGRSDAPEGWVDTLAALYLNESRFGEAEPLLEQLAVSYSKRRHWVRLAAAQSALGRDAEALVSLELSHLQGQLTEHTDLVRLAQLYAYQGIPYKCAVLLESELEAGHVENTSESWSLVGRCWLSARETSRAVEPLEKAAKLERRAGGWLDLARVLIELERWRDAERALQSALDRGDADESEREEIPRLREIVRYYQDRQRRGLDPELRPADDPPAPAPQD